LIRLVDDTDPEILDTVYQELFSMGESGLEKLKLAAKDSQNIAIKPQLEEIIARIIFDFQIQKLMNWRRNGGVDLLEGWVLLTQFEFPEITYVRARKEINRVVNKIWLMLSPHLTEIDKIQAINHFLFRTEHYQPCHLEFEKPRHTLLFSLLEHKTGSPLALAVLYLIICLLLDLPVHLTHFGRYYVLRYHGQNEDWYIDPFTQGQIASELQVKSILEKHQLDTNLSHYKPMSNIFIILEMLDHLIFKNQLKGDLEEANRYEKVRAGIKIDFT
ncbi:MAG: transglutaminase-like domain-containing protein, partial [Bacteroidia bacterium]|nr:transglutaminase-like domain-containing protein [Bacteroidia bacterium]